jgi:methionine synthase II (cobalamin-independent)
MFATLHGAYPHPAVDPGDPAAVDAAVAEVLEQQAGAGLTLLTDGGIHDPDLLAATVAGMTGLGLRATGPGSAARVRVGGLPEWRRPGVVDGWQLTAALSQLPVKARIIGPYSLGRRAERRGLGRRRLTLAFARALNAELRALADAGCAFVQVEEDDAIRVGRSAAERALFREAQDVLLDGVPDAPAGLHRSLAVSGGNADIAGPETFFSAAYESYFFDLIQGPDNWRLITRAPAERGIICGAVDARDPRIDDKELVIWAASYAASGGRGYERVGVAPAGSLAGLDPLVARRKIDVLGTSARIVEARAETPIQAQLDPRAVDSRSAAVGRWTPPSELPPRRSR